MMTRMLLFSIVAYLDASLLISLITVNCKGMIK